MKEALCCLGIGMQVQPQACLVVIRNVPCFERAQCGEVEISDETMRSLERAVDTRKKLVQEVAVVDYRMVV